MTFEETACMALKLIEEAVYDVVEGDEAETIDYVRGVTDLARKILGREDNETLRD